MGYQRRVHGGLEPAEHFFRTFTRISCFAWEQRARCTFELLLQGAIRPLMRYHAGSLCLPLRLLWSFPAAVGQLVYPSAAQRHPANSCTGLVCIKLPFCTWAACEFTSTCWTSF